MTHVLFQARWFIERGRFLTADAPEILLDVAEQGFRLVIGTHRQERREEDDTELQVEIVAFLHRSVTPTIADALVGGGVDLAERLASRQNGLDGYPEEYQRFVEELRRAFKASANRALGVAAWRVGMLSGSITLAEPDEALIRWAAPDELDRAARDDADAHFHLLDAVGQRLPHPLPVGILTIHFPRYVLGEQPRLWDSKGEIEDLLRTDAEQPLYHELLREAWSNLHEHPRSAVVMCMAAVETGVKTLVADLQPDAAWFVENGPSPPVERMLRQLLPQLRARNTFDGRVRPPDSAAMRVIVDGIALRNRLVHGRADTVDADSLEELLTTARGVLYLFDFYRGHQWARQHVGAVLAPTP